jgi:LppX_LprAFG lipoprotein
MLSSYILVRRTSALVLLCLATALLVAGCRLPWQHSSFNILGPRPTAQQLLAAVRKNFSSVSAFHVVMRVQNAGAATGSQFQIRSADGDVIMPDRIKAQATIILSGQPVTVNLISIGDMQFITDPVTGQWRVIRGALDPRTLTNPRTGIISVVSQLKNVSAPTEDTINGIPCWRITGKLDATALAFITGGGVPAGTILQTSECIGKADSLLYQVIVTGEAAIGYTPQTTLTFLLSNYDEHVTIAAPQM